MEYFLHSTMARYADALKQLEHDYGLAAVGFFWKAVELIFVNNGVASYAAVLALRARPLRFNQAVAIVKYNQLFVFNKHEATVRLNPDVQNGLYRMPRRLSSSRRRTDAGTGASTGVGEASVQAEAGASVGTEACTDVGADASPHASVPAVPSEIERREKEEVCENNLRATHTREVPKELQTEQMLQTFLASRCPSLLEMEEPLTVDEYLELRRRYDRHDIEQVLLDMHNDFRTANARSCYALADKWLRVRCTRRG